MRSIKMGLDINKRLMDKTDCKSLDRYNKAIRLRSDRNRAREFFAHEDYSEDPGS